MNQGSRTTKREISGSENWGGGPPSVHLAVEVVPNPVTNCAVAFSKKVPCTPKGKFI